MRIANGDIELHVEVDGPEDAPPVLFLHGITMSTATWDFLVDDVAADHRVVRLDFRGHGRSDRAPGTYGFGGYASDALAAIETVIGGPCVVVGHSLGGVTGAAVAQQRPDLVRAILLEDPAIFAPPKAKSDVGAADAVSEGMAENSLLELFTLMFESVPKLQASGLSAAALAEILGEGPSPAGPKAKELYHEDTMLAWAASNLALDVDVLRPVVDPSSMDPVAFTAGGFDSATPISVPGVILAGDPALPDTVLRAGAIELLTTLAPDVRVEVVEGVGHMIHDDRASRGQFVTTLRQVLTSHAG